MNLRHIQGAGYSRGCVDLCHPKLPPLSAAYPRYNPPGALTTEDTMCSLAGLQIALYSMLRIQATSGAR
jgi:hypothetical protein